MGATSTSVTSTTLGTMLLMRADSTRGPSPSMTARRSWSKSVWKDRRVAPAMNKLPVPGWKWRRIKKTRRILSCGNHPQMINPVGIVHGGGGARAGILNVR